MTKLIHISTVPQSLEFVGGQAAFMKARGIEVAACSSSGEFLCRFGEREGIQVFPIDMARRITPLRDLVALIQIRALLRRLRPQIVHAHTPKGGLLGMIGAWMSRVPLRIYHMHGLPYLTAVGWKRRLLMWSEFVSCRLAHRIICVSPSVRDVAIAASLTAPEKILVLHHGSCNGVDAVKRFNPFRLGKNTRAAVRKKYGIPESAQVVGFVGRVVKSKGVVELAEAWSSLRREKPGLHLLLVGPTESGDPVPPAVLESLYRDRRVHFVGENWDVAPLYTAMDVLVLPSYREGFGVVLIEAAAMKLPVVATRVAGCVDAVDDGVTGTLISLHDSDQLFQAVCRYLDDPCRALKHGVAGRARVLRDFRPEDIWQAIYEQYMRT